MSGANIMENAIVPNIHPSLAAEPSTRPSHHGSAIEPSQRPLMTWTGRVLSGLVTVFLLGASAAPKLLGLPVAEETMAALGWPPGYAFSIGILEATCVLLYLVPRTSVFGAVLTMGLLGGAMGTQLRAQMPLWSHVLFSVYVGLFIWGGLWLRNPRLRALFPLERTERAKH
jgi:hypothetical protein